MKTKFLLSNIFFLAYFLFFQQGLIAQSEAIPLIGKVILANTATESFNGEATALRSQIVSLNDIQAAELIQLNLFEEIRLTAEKTAIDAHTNGAKVWRGKIVGQDWGYVLVSEFKNQYWVKIELDNGQLFQIQAQSEGESEPLYALQELIASNEEDFSCDGEVKGEDKLAENHQAQSRNSSSVCDVNADCSNKVVNILMVYTQAAIGYFGTAAATEASIAAHVSEINTINSNSGVNHTVNLVHIAQVDYTEVDGQTDLNRMANPSDGYLDEVIVLRNQYGADIVSMVSLSACGLAYVPTNPTNFTPNSGFNLVAPGCMVGGKSLAHEVGHNLGLRHDRYAYNSLPDIACDWAWGFVDPGYEWRTIMAYGNECFDNNASCNRILHWSNPDVQYNGDPTGIPIGQTNESNSAYLLNRSFCVVADYLPEPPCHPDFLSLQAIYNSAGGASWGVNWDVSNGGNCDICTWDGIQCDGQGRVISLDLSNLGLNGTLPDELVWLSALKDLNISGNANLTGSIPDGLGLLTQLETLDLSNNNLTGSLPSTIGNLGKLEKCLLGNNALSGHISRKLGTLSLLTEIDLSNNNLQAFLPSSLGNLSNLSNLKINDNNLSGPLPEELADLSSSIQLINGDNNNFSDCFPVAYSALCGGGKTVTFNGNSNLQYQGDFSQFCASPNQTCNQQACSHPDYVALEAFFEATDGENWNNNDGWLANCDPCNGIPWTGITCTGNRVSSIFFISNSMTGSLPPEIGQLTELDQIWITSNNLSGALPQEMGQLTKLEAIQLSNNNLTGPIPNSFGQLTNLTYLSFANNDLSGPLPPDLVNAPLTVFSLFGNSNFSGCYPAGYSTLCGVMNVTQTALPDFNQFCTNGSGVCTECTHPDYAALDSLYNQTNGNNWNNNTGWLEDCDPCRGIKWFGVTCNTDSTRVLRLELDYNNLVGTLPAELGDLDSLEYLRMNNDTLSGTIPASLGSLTNLKSVLLYRNKFSGEIPPELGNLNLTNEGTSYFSGILNLSNNNLTGPIPASLGNLTEMEQFILANNDLSGCYPVELMALCNTVPTINLTGNPQLPSGGNFGGFCNVGAGACVSCSHPDYAALDSLYKATDGDNWNDNTGWLSNCDPCGVAAGNSPWQGISCTNNRVTGISLGGKGLSGVLPPEIGDFSELNFLNLALNNIGGTIPPEIGDLSNLKWSLELSRNQFIGSIPAELGDLSMLISLDLWDNNLSGTLPPELGVLPLNTFDVHNNGLDGCYPSNYMNFCGKTVDFSGNSLPDFATFCMNGTGSCEPICDPAHPDYAALEALYNSTNGPNWTNNTGWLDDCDYCNWSGVFCDGNDRVVVLDLKNNNLNGTLPDEISNLKMLKTLRLYNNQLVGNIPAGIGAMDSLETFWMSDNDLTGSIPSEISNLTKLSAILLDRNDISGNIPSWLGSMPTLTTIALGGNQLSGSIPPELGNLTALLGLSLFGNSLSGAIPPELGNLVNLRELALSFNLLSGSLSPTLSNLGMLETLGLHNNPNLSGCYPTGYNIFCNINSVNFSGTMLPDFDDYCNDITDECGNLSSCPTTLNLTGLSESPMLFEAADSISSEAIIPDIGNPPPMALPGEQVNPNDFDVIYKAGEIVILKPGFHAQVGANFIAYIEDCAEAVYEPAETLLATDRSHPTTLSVSGLEIDFKVYPNPFNQQTTIEFLLEKPSQIQLQLIDLRGQLVQIVLSNNPMAAGNHQVTLYKNNLPTGIYFLQLTSETTQMTKKIMLIE